MALTVLVLFGLLCCLGITVAGLSVGRTVLPAAVGLLLCSALWLPADRRMEGPVLIVLGAAHGITLADLLALAGAVLALVTLGRHVWLVSEPGDRGWNVALVIGCCWAVMALGALLALAASL